MLKWLLCSCRVSAFKLSSLTILIAAFAFTFQSHPAHAATNYTQSMETIKGMNYTVITVQYSGDDAGPAVAEAIAAAKNAPKPVILDFPTGTYHFKDASAITADYYVSNTASQSSNPDGASKKVAILFKDIQDMTIRGNHSTFMFHGVVTPIVFDHVTNVNMEHISFDFKRPVVSELTVQAVSGTSIEAEIHEDSLYSISNNQLKWTGEVDHSGNPLDNWTARGYSNITQVQEYDPVTKETWRRSNPLSGVTSVQDLGNRRVRFNYNSAPSLTVGHTFQFRNDIRKEQGAFIYRSKDITWTGVNFYAAPGLGIVAQYSENLFFEQFNFAPRVGSGRTNASMADFMQFSGCKGEIKVNDSNFFGAHDDPINVHGTHLQIVDKPAPNQIKVQFKHDQSWGFDAFAVNDAIEYINASSLLAVDHAIVTAVTRVDNYNILLTLDRNVPSSVTVNQYMVENATWTPNVTITGSTFESVPTRGILVTTRGKVLIDHNTFDRTRMSAILIADDASSWYESGMVRDVTISNNTFNYTGNAVIDVDPSTSSTDPAKTVHSNIRVDGNIFKMNGTANIQGKGVHGFSFTNNVVQEGGLSLDFRGSKSVAVAGNTFTQSGVTKKINFYNMYPNYDAIDPNQGFIVSRSNDQVLNSNDIPWYQITATATSQQDGHVANQAVDGEGASFWQSASSPSANLPQSITLEFGGSYTISKLRYLPRLDGQTKGMITSYRIEASTDGGHFIEVARGNWADDITEKTAAFAPVSAKYVRLTAITASGNLAAAAAIHVERYDLSMEGESGTISGNAKIGNLSAASGGQYVGNIGNDSNSYVTLKADVPAAGTYKMTIYSILSGTRSFFVSVNGGAAQEVKVTGSSWSQTASPVSLTIQLNSGNNSIKFYNDAAYTPDLDRIVLSEVVPVDNKLKSIQTPAAITGLAIGTAKTAAALGLPDKVSLLTYGGVVDANVSWDMNGTNYDPTAITGQIFTVTGIVTLPSEIVNPDNVPLTTSVRVTVNNIPQSQMKAAATSEETSSGNDRASNAIDGNPQTMWHTKWDKSDVLPQSITLNLGGTYQINQVAYMPRQSGSNGIITGYNVYVSTDGVTFTKAASGKWADDSTLKYAAFAPIDAAYVKLEATAGVNGWASAAEINVLLDTTGGPQTVITGTDKVSPGQTFHLTMGLSGVTQSVYQRMYAQDLTLHYDPAYMQFESVTSLKDGFQVIDQKEAVPGHIRIVAASVGANQGVQAQGDLLTFKFTVRAATQGTETTASVDHVAIASGEGNELEVNGTSHKLHMDISVDKSRLNAAIVGAQTKHDAAVEGNGHGLYAVGSKAQLQSAINAARATESDPNVTQQQVDSAKTALEAAVQVFESKKISADVNGKDGITVGDLAIVAAAYGKQEGQPGWNAKADVNHDGKVDIEDLAIVAKAILQ
ncbi:discoidin domain-containing protein [Paenibacillus sp. GCM10027629]